nr:MAG TPA: hypothetical protein [Caudoviricetes sp.]
MYNYIFHQRNGIKNRSLVTIQIVGVYCFGDLI